MVVQQTHPKREDSNRVKVIVSPVGRQGRPGTPGVSIRFFDTLQEALDLQPRPENGVTFQVREESDPENFGFYVFDDREPEGYRYLGERWDDEYLTQIENRIDAFEQDVEGQVQGLDSRVEGVETDVAGFKAEVNQRVEDVESDVAGFKTEVNQRVDEVEDAVQSLQDTTARYAFDTLQQAQDKWAEFSQAEKDELDGKTFVIGNVGEYVWDSSEEGGVRFVMEFPEGLTIEQKEVFEDITEIIPSTNLYDSSKNYPNHILDGANGNVVSLSGYSISDFIPVQPGQEYILNSDRTIAFYNSLTGELDQNADAYVSSLPGGGIIQERVITIPDGMQYARFALKNTWVNDLYFRLSAEETEKKETFVKSEKVLFQDKKLSEFLSSLNPDELNYLSERVPGLLEEKSTNVTHENVYDPAQNLTDYIVDGNGAIVPLAGYSVSGTIPVEPGEEYRLNSDRAIALYINEPSVITQSGDDVIKALDGGGIIQERVITIPDGMHYARFALKNTWTEDLFFRKEDSEELETFVKSEKVIYEDTDLKDYLNSIDIFQTENKTIENKNLFDNTLLNYDYIISGADGSVVELQNYAVSDFIPVESGQEYILNSDRAVAFYEDLSGEFDQPADDYLNSMPGGGTIEERIITVPDGMNYMRVAIKTPWRYDIYVKKYPVSYEVSEKKVKSDNVEYNGNSLTDYFNEHTSRNTEFPKAYPLRKRLNNASITKDYIYGAIDDSIVRYGLDEVEEVLLTLPGITDWRSVWSSSHGYVFASPMDSVASGVAVAEVFGLYKFDGANYSKVIDLDRRSVIWSIDEDTEGNIYAGVYALGGEWDARVLKSTDGGDTWDVVFNPDVEHCHAMHVDKTTGVIYFCAGDDYGGHLNYKSADGGATWTEILYQPVNQMTAVIATPTCRLFGTDQKPYGRIYRTTDDWEYEIVLDTHYQNVFFLRQSDVTGYIYAGFKLDPSAEGDFYTDIWYSKDDGKNWELLIRVEDLQPSDGFWYGSNFFEGNMLAGFMKDGEFVEAIGITESSQHFYTSDGIEGTKIKPFLKS